MQLLGETVVSLASAIGPGRARAVFRALSRGEDPFDLLPAGTLRRIPVDHIVLPAIANEARAGDGTTKLLLELEDGLAVEAVLIPSPSRTTLCVSTQVGCLRGCTFCRTATMGLVRNLEASEIVSQLFVGIRTARRAGLAPITNVVFMGMGEPLDNPVATRTALDIMTDGFGIGPGHITVSTVAPSPKAVARMEGWPCRIAWSLHAARDDVRRRLVPTARHSTAELAAAFASLGAPLFVEITLIAGVNDQLEDADAVAALVADHPAEVRINLLPMNPIDSAGPGPAKPDHPSSLAFGSLRAPLANPLSGTKLETSCREASEAFRNRLRSWGFFAKVRTARGLDRSAACGQLVTLSLQRP